MPLKKIINSIPTLTFWQNCIIQYNFRLHYKRMELVLKKMVMIKEGFAFEEGWKKILEKGSSRLSRGRKSSPIWWLGKVNLPKRLSLYQMTTTFKLHSTEPSSFGCGAARVLPPAHQGGVAPREELCLGVGQADWRHLRDD